MCQIDLVLRYFDFTENKVNGRYWDVRFLDHGCHQDLLNSFCDSMNNLDPNRLLQTSMDGPNVDITYSILLIHWEEKEQHQLIDTGNCRLLILYGVFQNGGISSEWEIKELLKSSLQLLYDTPAKREDYLVIAGSTLYLKNFLFNKYFRLYPCQGLLNVKATIYSTHGIVNSLCQTRFWMVKGLYLGVSISLLTA